jgi:hypothetical protein
MVTTGAEDAADEYASIVMSWWVAGHKAAYDCIKAFSETDIRDRNFLLLRRR